MAETNYTLGACGLYCGACVHLKDNVEEDPSLFERRAKRGTTLDEFVCGGCSSGDLYIHPGCRDCPTRVCVSERGIATCAECEDVPCSEIQEFNDDGRPHHADVISNLDALRELKPEEWLRMQDRRWRCECGRRFTWYTEECSGCGKKVDSYTPD